MKYYVDLTSENGCFGILFTHPENVAVYTGTLIHTEEVKLRSHPLVERFAKGCDFHFFFEGDELPKLYTVPQTEIGGYDSEGGLFTGSYYFTIRDPEPIYYIDREGKCFLITEDSRKLLDMGLSWRERMVPSDTIQVFASRAEAEQKYDIKDVKDLLGEDL